MALLTTQDVQPQTKDQMQDDFALAVKDGLCGPQKAIPCIYLYDARGSDLFEQITELPEYYPTRTEIALLEKYAGEIAALRGPGAALIEFGSGASRKTSPIIEAMENIAAYVPIDISDAALEDAEQRLHKLYPNLTIHPLHGDFNQPLQLPASIADVPHLGFFPGSTIGNFHRAGAEKFMRDAASSLGKGSAFVVGVDLKKDINILLPAYNDTAGITAAFAFNLLHRINRELEGNFLRENFSYDVRYNEEMGRVELYIKSLLDQEVSVMGQAYHFGAGELIHVENSHKYTLEEFQVLARASGWEPVKSWTDEKELFSLHYLRCL